jgi:hypothetical protein
MQVLAGESNNLGEMGADMSVVCRRFLLPSQPTLDRGLVHMDRSHHLWHILRSRLRHTTEEILEL